MRFPSEKSYPKNLRIGRADYQIRFVNKIGKDPLIVGFCTSDPPIIRIKRRSNKKMAQTFLHELLHAIEFEYALKIRHKLIYQLAKAITILLKRNM